MGFLTDISETTKRVEAVFYDRLITDEGSGKFLESFSEAFRADVFFWTGSGAERYVSEKIRPLITGVILIDYRTDIDERMKVVVNGADYGIIYVEDIAFQNEIILLPVKRYE